MSKTRMFMGPSELTRVAPARTSINQLAFHGYWWEDPARLMMFFIFPLYALISISLLGNQKAIDRVFFDGFYAFAGALFLIIIMVVSSFARRTPGKTSRVPSTVSPLVLDLIFVLSCIGYLTMMGGLLAKPALLMAFFDGSDSAFDLLEVKGRVPGISTLTQAAIAYVPLYFYIFQQRKRGLSRHKLYFAILFALTALRSFIFAERLALIELALPLALMWVKFRRPNRPSKILMLGPYLCVMPLIAFFIANEYQRSWAIYYVNLYDNIFDFALERLGLYYSTAINNGAALLSIFGWGTGSPEYTFDWLIRFPLIGDYFRPLFGLDASYNMMLARYADPEFNNPSGIFVHFYEWGWSALFLAAFIGWLFRKSYYGWRAANGFWCCAHPVLLISLFEILRLPNLFSGRNFVPIALLFIVFSLCRTKSARPLNANPRPY
ncbi:MAG TPA: oligosaccharide repeat unit polymerase [Paraburkholderia sp.]|uniref:oligosaccharide repeat unit polymerase n=1 Tax=Paraburkholderia sp. TaxID=1926495 RepID=UPI002ED6385B